MVDTGAWIALLSRTDQYRDAAQIRYRELAAEGTRLVTTNYIVDETATRLRYGAGLDAALAYRRMLDASVNQQRLQIVWVDEPLEGEGWRLLEQYGDVVLSLTDAVTAAVARRSKIEEIFGFDSDFEALGLVVRPGPTRKR
jgi:uncharacterized protein